MESGRLKRNVLRVHSNVIGSRRKVAAVVARAAAGDLLELLAERKDVGVTEFLSESADFHTRFAEALRGLADAFLNQPFARRSAEGLAKDAGEIVECQAQMSGQLCRRGPHGSRCGDVGSEFFALAGAELSRGVRAALHFEECCEEYECLAAQACIAKAELRLQFVDDGGHRGKDGPGFADEADGLRRGEDFHVGLGGEPEAVKGDGARKIDQAKTEFHAGLEPEKSTSIQKYGFAIDAAFAGVLFDEPEKVFGNREIADGPVVGDLVVAKQWIGQTRRAAQGFEPIVFSDGTRLRHVITGS